MPRLAICNRDLHWQWINWTLLFDTMEVSMVRLASLAIAQHVFQPALESPLTGRPESGPELILRKIVSCEREQRLYRGEQISRKNVSRELGPTSYRDFAKNIALMGAKNGVQHATAIYPIPRYTRPRYIGLTLYAPVNSLGMGLTRNSLCP